MNGMIQRLTRYKGPLLSITCFVGFGVLVLTDFGDGLRDSIMLLALFALGAVGLLTGSMESSSGQDEKWEDPSDPRSDEHRESYGIYDHRYFHDPAIRDD